MSERKPISELEQRDLWDALDYAARLEEERDALYVMIFGEEVEPGFQTLARAAETLRALREASK